jgi:hypothetical protein
MPAISAEVGIRFSFFNFMDSWIPVFRGMALIVVYRLVYHGWSNISLAVDKVLND